MRDTMPWVHVGLHDSQALTCLGHDVAHLGIVQQPPHFLLPRQCCIAHHTPFIMVTYSIQYLYSRLRIGGSKMFEGMLQVVPATIVLAY